MSCWVARLITEKASALVGSAPSSDMSTLRPPWACQAALGKSFLRCLQDPFVPRPGEKG